MRALVFVVFEGTSRNCLANNNIDYLLKGRIKKDKGMGSLSFCRRDRSENLDSRTGLHQLSMMKLAGKLCYSLSDTDTNF